MESFADMECSLKVDSKCESCLKKMIKVLRSIRGVYSVSWDAQQSSVQVRGEVNPNILLKAVMSSGKHAELLNVKLNHPQLRHNHYNYGSGTTPYDHRSSYSDYRPYGRQHPPAIEYPYGHPQQPAIEHLPRETYVPSYPHQEYNPNDNYEGMSACSIM
ncbi:hypothetical protein OSB04_004473 [Centaurea solstitialis]|uniref:HMA domain-containing protein n=1 Tax=Centaurea solstitialis TaxID=347529 RepID=A0AA38WPS0_9ASTR|nr:hypothetical protein OSB04_004473 [Centaurea solstitialis]